MTAHGKGGRPTIWVGGGGIDIKTLETMGVAQLRALFQQVFGEPTQSNNSTWLRRKLSQPRDEQQGNGKKISTREADNTAARRTTDEPRQNADPPRLPRNPRPAPTRSGQEHYTTKDTEHCPAPVWGAGVCPGGSYVLARPGMHPPYAPPSACSPTEDSDGSARSMAHIQASSRLHALAAAAAAVADDQVQDEVQPQHEQAAGGQPQSPSAQQQPSSISQLHPDLEGQQVWLYEGGWRHATVTQVDAANCTMWVQYHSSSGSSSGSGSSCPQCFCGSELQQLLSSGGLAAASSSSRSSSQARPGGRAKRARSPEPPAFEADQHRARPYAPAFDGDDAAAATGAAAVEPAAGAGHSVAAAAATGAAAAEAAGPWAAPYSSHAAAAAAHPSSVDHWQQHWAWQQQRQQQDSTRAAWEAARSSYYSMVPGSGASFPTEPAYAAGPAYPYPAAAGAGMYSGAPPAAAGYGCQMPLAQPHMHDGMQRPYHHAAAAVHAERYWQAAYAPVAHPEPGPGPTGAHTQAGHPLLPN